MSSARVTLSTVAALVAACILVAPAAVVLGAAPTGAAPGARGFDGTTLKVGGMGPFSTFAGADLGARARLARANADREVPGIDFEYVGYRDSGDSAAAASSAATALIDEDGVFAIVPNLSQFTPGDTLTSRRVPWFGWGFDPAYCTASKSTTGYGFAFSGCLAPAAPARVPETGAALFAEVGRRTGAAAPTVAVISTATDGGRQMVGAEASSLAAAGFDVVYAKGSLPVPPTVDPSAVAEALLLSGPSGPPDAVVCLATSECLGVRQMLTANNFFGSFVSLLYADTPIIGLGGALATPQYVPFTESTEAQQRMLADLRELQPDAIATPGVVAGYLGADMFVTALRALRDDDRPVTPKQLQAVAASTRFHTPGLYGPVKYPAAFTRSVRACTALVVDAGIGWGLVDPYTCTDETVPIEARFAQIP